MRVAIYTRVPTKGPGQETANQLDQLREFCRHQDWTVVREYEDHDSGNKADRTQFQAMLADASQRRFDVVLFWALNRFSRECALRTLQHLNRLSNCSVGFRSFTEPYLDSVGIFKDVLIPVLGTIAKQERERISERVRAGLARARVHGTRSGKPIGRPAAVFSRDQVLELRARGLSWREIAKRTHSSISSVRRAFRQRQPS